MIIPEYILILVVTVIFTACFVIVFFLTEITKEKYLRKNIRSYIPNRGQISTFINQNAYAIIGTGFYSIVLFIMIRLHYMTSNLIEFQILIRVSAVLLTLFIGYLFAKLFQVRKEKLDVQSTLKDFAYKLTGYRRLIFLLMSSDKFWIKKEDMSIAKYKYPKIGFEQLELDLDFDYEMFSAFNSDPLFNSTRVNIFYIMEAIVRQRYEGWKFDWVAEIKYPKRALEWLIKPIEQMYYYFDYKYAKHTKGKFDWNQLTYSYYYQDILKQIKLLFPEYENITSVDNKTIGEISSRINSEVLEKMNEITKYNYEYFTRNMRVIVNFMILTLVVGILAPMIGELVSDSHIINHILGFISYWGVGVVIIWVIFELKSIIFEELNTA